MTQQFTQVPVRQTHYILIIDDSARLRYALADLMISQCTTSGKGYRVFHCDKDGRYVQSGEGLSVSKTEANGEAARQDEFAIYTAPSPKHALFVINSPLFSQLTIISDVMMPADTEVGLVGMLEAIAKRNLSVNLFFASSDAQNRQVVSRLVDSGKAYFAVKASGMWEQLAQALVHRTDSFIFKKITANDFTGVQNAASHALGSNPPLGTLRDSTTNGQAYAMRQGTTGQLRGTGPLGVYAYPQSQPSVAAPQPPAPAPVTPAPIRAVAPQQPAAPPAQAQQQVTTNSTVSTVAQPEPEFDEPQIADETDPGFKPLKVVKNFFKGLLGKKEA